jgi:3-oxoacyl-[acyl-carrier-protein] synthase III
MAPPRTASVLGLGHYLPAEVLPNERIAERIGVDEWIVKRTWLTGLALAAGVIGAGRLDRVLLIGAEVLTRLTNYDDRKTAALWGDGAGAVVVGSDGGGAAGGEKTERVDHRGGRLGGVGAQARGHVRLPPGQRSDSARRPRAPRCARGEGGRLHRRYRKHVRRVDPADAGAAARG